MVDKVFKILTEFNFEKPEEPSLIFSNMIFADQNLNQLGESQTPKAIGTLSALVENVAPGCTIAINKSARDLLLQGGVSR